MVFESLVKCQHVEFAHVVITVNKDQKVLCKV